MALKNKLEKRQYFNSIASGRRSNETAEDLEPSDNSTDSPKKESSNSEELPIGSNRVIKTKFHQKVWHFIMSKGIAVVITLIMIPILVAFILGIIKEYIQIKVQLDGQEKDIEKIEKANSDQREELDKIKTSQNALDKNFSVFEESVKLQIENLKILIGN